MSGVVNGLLEELEQRLGQAGLQCMRHYPVERIRRWTEPVAVLGLRGLELAGGGFGDYLGTVTDGTTGNSREVYGRRGTARLAMDIYCSPEGQDAEGRAAAALDTALGALLGAGGRGMDFRSYEQGEPAFDTASGMYRIRAELCFEICLTGQTVEESAEITDFRLGEITVNV